MIKIMKKNQLTILVLAFMLVTAGYLNYNNSIPTSTEIASIGDATLVSANLSNTTIDQTENMKEDVNTKKEEIASSVATTEENIVQTSSAPHTNTSEYFSNTRLDRDTMYSQMLEAYQKILDSQTTSTKQKEAAQEQISSINKIYVIMK